VSASDPFAVLDQEGVGKLVEDCVSCSPYRVPIARLGAAQAAIAGEKRETMRTV
jgi:pyruvate,orthophosphate dikinase